METLAAQIRTLKAELGATGLKSADINRHPEVLAKVAALKELKSTLASDDPARDEAFFARQKEEREEALRREQALVASQREELAAVEAKVARPLVQRKIFHLFQFTGSGPTFHYEPPARFNASQCGFGAGAEPMPGVYVTEKWDGTTMQATSTCIFKRLDLRAGKRSNLDPSERYDLRVVAWRSEDTGGRWRGLDFADADRRVAEALTLYLPKLEAMDDDLCVYFEVVHTDINATYKHLPRFADIRVFDFSRTPRGTASSQGRFLPFEETISLAGTLRLPLVGWQHAPCLDAEAEWARLEEAKRRHYEGVAAPLEGFVVREAGRGERIAKARVEQLHLHAASSPAAAAASSPSAASLSVPAKPQRKQQQQEAPEAPGTALPSRVDRRPGRLEAAHLEELGLWPGGDAYVLRNTSDA